MYYNNIYMRDYTIDRMPERSTGSVRVLHAVPDAPGVDIYVNDEIIARNLKFGENTPYARVPAGKHHISLYVAGTKESPVLTNSLVVDPNSATTVAAAGTLDTIGFLAIPDSPMTMQSGKSMVRFSHLSPNAPAVDITLPDGTVLFDDVSFKELTSYIAVSPMNYTLQVRLAGTPDVVLTVPNVRLDPNKAYTVYAVGFAGREPKLEALLLTDK
jgi:hypothetical protein